MTIVVGILAAFMWGYSAGRVEVVEAERAELLEFARGFTDVMNAELNLDLDDLTPEPATPPPATQPSRGIRMSARFRGGDPQ